MHQNILVEKKYSLIIYNEESIYLFIGIFFLLEYSQIKTKNLFSYLVSDDYFQHFRILLFSIHN